MNCPDQPWASNEEYLRTFGLMAEQRRIPLSGSFEITHRCNLSCIHCYLQRSPSEGAGATGEMGGAAIRSLLDDMTGAGCLYLLITGGEPLLREDFPEIYRHARENGLMVFVFTNGTLMNERVVELFADLPPVEVEISLYGSTAETYEAITRIPGSYERCMGGIRRLLDGGIKVNLKTVLMTRNRHEFFAIEDVARELGVRFRFDAAISPCINGAKTPLELRVPPLEAVQKEFANSERAAGWKKYFEKNAGYVLGESLYGCGAGITGFHVDPYGFLYPCLMTLHMRVDIRDGGFLRGWQEEIGRMREKKVDYDFGCRTCKKVHLCGFCPAFFRLENGAEDEPSRYLCEMGHRRFEYLQECCT